MTKQETTKKDINKLIEFRQAVYENGMQTRRDAMFDLLDALISEGVLPLSEVGNSRKFGSERDLSIMDNS